MRAIPVTMTMMLLAALNACGGGDDDDDDQTGDGSVGDDDDDDSTSLYDPAIATVTIEIDYGADAAPYTGEVVGFGDLWDVSATNLARLFQGTDKTLVVPRELRDMESLGDLGDGPFTSAALLALADAHRDLLPDAVSASFYVLFVDGYFDDGSGAQTSVLGVSLGSTHVIAMFKPVIESTSSPLVPNIERYVEQSTLIHELGHGVGLVDNGIPMASAHRDEEHGKHCNNDGCLMFWLNDGAGDAVGFVQQHLTSGDDILFDARCLADVDALIAASAE